MAGAAEAVAPVLSLRVAGVQFAAELALTDAEQEHGLMGRTSLVDDTGMLFPLPFDHQACVWMKATPMPLSVAFIDSTGRIVNVLELEPNDLAPRCAARPSRYILEAPAGWFAQHHADEGAQINGLPGVDLAR